jgi:hypothetical protein
MEMTQSQPIQVLDADIPDPRWKDLYRFGCIACAAFPAFIIAAVIAYFIWPYSPGFTSVADIFADLQNNRLGGLASLDLSVVIMMPVLILEMLALYAALKRFNESYALIALVLGLVGVILWLVSKPLVEMVYLSNQYAAATSEAERSHYLAAGEALSAISSGTAWMLSQFLISISGGISCMLMLRSHFFSRMTAYIGLAMAVLGVSFWIPGIGPILSLLATIGGVIWYALMARDFYRLGWRQSIPALTLP